MFGLWALVWSLWTRTTTTLFKELFPLPHFYQKTLLLHGEKKKKKKKGDFNFVTFFHPSKSLPRSSVICRPFILCQMKNHYAIILSFKPKPTTWIPVSSSSKFIYILFCLALIYVIFPCSSNCTQSVCAYLLSVLLFWIYILKCWFLREKSKPLEQSILGTFSWT